MKILKNFQILRIFDFFFFENSCWIPRLIWIVFLICQNPFEFLCATCPNIKIFIGDNFLMHKVSNYCLVLIVAHILTFMKRVGLIQNLLKIMRGIQQKYFRKNDQNQLTNPARMKLRTFRNHHFGTLKDKLICLCLVLGNVY